MPFVAQACYGSVACKCLGLWQSPMFSHRMSCKSLYPKLWGLSQGRVSQTLQVTTGATLLLSEHSASVTWFMLGSHSITAGQASPPCLRALGSSVELFAWLSWEQLICSEQFGSLQVSIISDCFPWLALRWSALCVYRYCTFTYVFIQSLQINIHTGYIREKVFNHGICCEQVGAVGNPINLGFWFCFLAVNHFVEIISLISFNVLLSSIEENVYLWVKCVISLKICFYLEYISTWSKCACFSCSPRFNSAVVLYL